MSEGALPPVLSALDEGRLVAWRALSDLFLDTEVDEQACAFIAERVAGLPFSMEALEAMVFFELGPGLGPVLASGFGPWSGFADEDLAARVVPLAVRRRAGWPLWRRWCRWRWGGLVGAAWEQVRAHLERLRA